MTTTKAGPRASFAVCLENEGFGASLERHKIYRVLADEEAAREGMIRVLDESGDDYLYPSAWFEPIQVPGAVARSLLRTAG